MIPEQRKMKNSTQLNKNLLDIIKKYLGYYQSSIE